MKRLDSLWNSSDPAASEASFLSLLRSSVDLPEKDFYYRIELLSQLARAQMAQNKYTEARVVLDEAEKMLENPQIHCPVSVKIRWSLERGRLFMFEKTPSRAHPLFEEAWPLAENSGEDHLIVELAQLLAVIEPQKNQQKWIQKAIDVAERSPQPKAKEQLGSLYTALAWKLYDLRQHEKALLTFQKSLSHLKAYGTEREIFVAKWSAGKVLRAMNRTEEALAIQQGLLAEKGLTDARDGRLYEEIAECLQTLKKTSEAQLYFEMAYKELSSDEWAKDNQPVALQRMKNLGKVKKPKKTDETEE